MKHRIRKTGEIITVISYNSDTVRKETDSVSYIDSSGIEHVKERLNYYWDLEELPSESKIDWDKELIDASKLILSSSINRFDKYKDSVKYSINCASYLINKLRDRMDNNRSDEIFMKSIKTSLYLCSCKLRLKKPNLAENIIKNLEELGYRKLSESDSSSSDYIYTDSNGNYNIGSEEENEALFTGSKIDCEFNETLFKYLVSLRNNTDKNQWFTDGVMMIYCDNDSFINFYNNRVRNNNRLNKDSICNFHKATVIELINQFSDR